MNLLWILSKKGWGKVRKGKRRLEKMNRNHPKPKEDTWQKF
jgi:hypothetical protein